ncbi:hypothetical protein HanRHA438_Chr03g0143611 [Helianthus annuus]|nr:hypothetical protein HanRHA438_Chr03g0143611 [Helianthus annuus]
MPKRLRGYIIDPPQAQAKLKMIGSLFLLVDRQRMFVRVASNNFIKSLPTDFSIVFMFLFVTIIVFCLLMTDLEEFGVNVTMYVFLQGKDDWTRVTIYNLA